MADIDKIKISNTVYNLKDSRVPALINSTTQFLRGDGTWSVPTSNVVDNGNHILFGPTSNWKLIASTEYAQKVTSTTNTRFAFMELGAAAYTSDKILCFIVRDKEGPRNGYFYATISFLVNIGATKGDASIGGYPKIVIKYENDKFAGTYLGNTTAYGIYPYTLTNTGKLSLYRRYNATYTGTIDSTYLVQIYETDFPNNLNILNLSGSYGTFAIATHPSDVTINVNDTAYFQVTVNGSNLTYQWQTKVDAQSEWKNTTLDGYNTNTLTVIANADRNGRKYRCVVTDGTNTEVSKAATLTVVS